MPSEPKLYITDKILAKIFLPFIPHFVMPNHITFLRFIATPLVLWLLWKGDYRWGLTSFVIVAFTDALDGALARTKNQITEWGKMYDPLADKLLVCSVIYIIVFKYLNFYLALAIVALEITIILFAILKKNQGADIQANWWGKIKMICQVLGISFLLLAIILHTSVLILVSSVIFILALLFGLVSLFTYSI